ncbi:MAG: phage tail assembly chaperone [Dyella sp.]
MFIVKAPETIPATLTIQGQGREQKLKLVYRHYTREARADLLEQLQKGDITPPALVMKLVESWEADVELDTAGITLVMEHQPGIEWAIIHGYNDALTVTRKGN